MRILHILDHSIPLHSGYTFRTRAILEQQRARGWETFHLTSPKHAQAAGTDVLEEHVDGFDFHRTSIPAGWTARLPGLSQWGLIAALERRLEQVVKETRPDILHAHSPALNGEAAVRVGRRYGIPVVYEVRAFWEDAAVDHGTSREGGLRYRLTRALETRVFRRADAVTTICEGLRRDIVDRGIAAGKVTVIPNAVDIERFRFGASRDLELARTLGLEDALVLGFIGSFYAYEGLPLLLEALPGIVRRVPDTRLLLVGGGPQEAELKRLAGELGLQDKVIFTGRVPHDQVQSYYDLVDVFAYPRLPMRLTDLVTPLKPLEAMAQGRLVVASDVGGHRELIRPGETGELFEAGNAEALASTVVDLLGRRDSWPERHAAGRRFVENERNWPGSVGRYQSVYEALVSGSGRTAPAAESR
jgi:PEP-CTERM/exosortase A-associated glycosyltransferase